MRYRIIILAAAYLFTCCQAVGFCGERTKVIVESTPGDLPRVHRTPKIARCARMSDMPRRKRRNYTPEQRGDAVRMVREVGNLAKVARDLDLTESALRHWVKQADIDEGHGEEGALATEERDELRRLRRENRTLQMERDFLKKAAAFFAKEQDRPTR